jgi:CheY-like chemotaxis protein
MAGNLRILLVDDNPMVLNMLRRELAELAPVTTASDGADALLKAVNEMPDLIVADFQMPGLNGRQLVETIRQRPTTSAIPFVMMATRTDISEKLRGIQGSVEDLVEKPFFLKDATARIKRVLDKIALEKMAREAPGETVLRGSLAQMNVIDLLQSLEMGRINHATYGPLRGDPAVYKVLTWTVGNFQIDFDGQSSEQSTTRSTQGLLMEGLRLLDESDRDGEEPGA